MYNRTKKYAKKLSAKILTALLSVLLFFSFFGCGVSDIFHDIAGIIQGENGHIQTADCADKQRIEYSEIILDSIKTNNVEKLKSVFCSKTQAILDIDKQIEFGFDFIKGNITEYKISPELNGENVGIDDGVVTLYAGSGDIYKIKTDENKWYEIFFHMYYVVKNEDRKGITSISIRDTNNTNDINVDVDCYDDDTIYKIGYMWKENYIYDSSKIAYDAIKAISESDVTELKKTFSLQILDYIEIDSQMQRAFEFFDGKPIFGEVKNRGELTYDGNRDFKINSCRDKVVIDNYQEVSVFVSVYTINIETDTGKNYEMELSAYIKNEKEPNLVGIEYLSLIDGENNATIGLKPNS